MKDNYLLYKITLLTGYVHLDDVNKGVADDFDAGHCLVSFTGPLIKGNQVSPCPVYWTIKRDIYCSSGCSSFLNE